jgi:hypothetical protein
MTATSTAPYVADRPGRPGGVFGHPRRHARGRWSARPRGADLPRRRNAEPFDKGLLRHAAYAYEVREQKDYFEDIPTSSCRRR